MPRLSDRESNNRKEAIIDAAENLFFTKGFLESKMEDVAVKVGMTRKTLYGYFKNKEDLYMSVFLRHHVEHLDYLTEKINEGTTGLEKIKAFGVAYFEYFESRREYLKFRLFLDFNGVSMKNVSQELGKRYREKADSFNMVIKKAHELGYEDGSIKENPDMQLVFSQFVFSSRAILNRALLYKEETLFASSMTEWDYYNKFLTSFLYQLSGGTYES